MARSFSVRLVSLFLVVLASVSLLTSVSIASAQDQAKAPDVKCVCGPKRVAVLLFDFEDVKHMRTNDYYSNIVKDMNASYYRQSYGQMWIVGGEVYGWYATTLKLGSLRVTTWYINYTDADKLEAVAKTKARQLGVAGDYIFAVFAGDVWGWATGHPSRLTVIGETSYDPPWIFMHEFGHNLGLPDLYNYDKLEAEPVGEWDLMDRGEELSAYSRLKLGWLPRDSVPTIDSRGDLTLLIKSLENPTGIRALKVQLFGSSSYYLVETRLKDQELRLVIYYIQGTIVSGKGSIVLETVLSSSDKPVFVGKRIGCALVVLDTQPEGLKVKLGTESQGKKAQDAFDALRSASNSIRDAWSNNRVQGLTDAKEEFDRAWQHFHNADFDDAKTSADKAKELAQEAVTPQSWNQFRELRPEVDERLQNATLFKSDEAMRYVELAKAFLGEADRDLSNKDFDTALQKLLEADENLAKAAEAEKQNIQARQTQAQQIQQQFVIVSLGAVVVSIVIIQSFRRSKRSSYSTTIPMTDSLSGQH